MFIFYVKGHFYPRQPLNVHELLRRIISFNEVTSNFIFLFSIVSFMMYKFFMHLV